MNSEDFSVMSLSQLYFILYIISVIFILIFLFQIYLLAIKKTKFSQLKRKPSVNLYIPCKDVSPSFEKNINSISINSHVHTLTSPFSEHYHNT